MNRPKTKVKTKVETDPQSICAECGRPFTIDLEGISHHTSSIDAEEFDYDADADHTPYGKDTDPALEGGGA